MRLGGLGLRSAARHAAAAYISSVSACVAACAQLDPSFRPDLSLPVAQYNAMVAASDHVPAPPALVRQQQLSDALDSAELTALHSTAEGEAARAHLRLLQQPGALHLTSIVYFSVCASVSLSLPPKGTAPCATGLRTSSETTLDAAPAGVTEANTTTAYARCWPNVLLQQVCPPEVEKAGLLPARPPEHGSCEAGGVSGQQGRRPADVYLPSWGLHGPAALDLAITSGMRGAILPASASDGAQPCLAYEDRKRSHLQTAQQCADQGIQFLPLVAEACGGGWGPVAVRTWRRLGALIAGRTGEPVSMVVERLHQALSVALQRENARAVLCRLPDAEGAERLLLD